MTTPVPPSDFNKEVAKAYRHIKEVFGEDKRRWTDKTVREQVNADLDHLIEKNEK